jgi:group I intron endonuclease
MKTRKDILREYKERKKPAGVFRLRNTVNGKFLFGSSLNLEGVFNRHKFLLSIGKHENEALLKDWKEYGADAFVFEILEEVRFTDDEFFDLKDELTLLEQIWSEKLQPFGENGYNTDPKIRQV